VLGIRQRIGMIGRGLVNGVNGHVGLSVGHSAI
jgi:hypothetical protein